MIFRHQCSAIGMISSVAIYRRRAYYFYMHSAWHKSYYHMVGPILQVCYTVRSVGGVKCRSALSSRKMP